MSSSDHLSPSTTSTLRTILDSPLYRGAAISLLLTGLGSSAVAPLIATFLYSELGASLGVAGLFYLTNLTAPVVGYLVGSRSDHTGERLGWFRLCSLAGAIGWVLFAIAPQLWMPFVINACILAFAGAAGAQLFAAIHDEQQVHPTPVDDGVVATIRMALTIGWVVGPVIGTVLAEWIGLRWMFAYCGVCFLAQIAPLIGVQPTSLDAGPDAAPAPFQRPTLRQMTPLLYFTAMFICVYIGEPIRYAFLPIYMKDDLHVSASVRGMVIGIQPLVETVIMPIAAIAARRYGFTRLLAVGAATCVAANLCFAFADSVSTLFAGQILMGIVWGVFFGLGIIVAQRLLSTAVATASAIFMNSNAIAFALGGMMGGFGASSLGLPHVFFVSMAMGAIATIGLLLMPRVTGTSM